MVSLNLVSAGLTQGAESVAARVGGAGIIEYPENPFAKLATAAARAAADSPDPYTRHAGKIMGSIPVRVPQTAIHLAHLFATQPTGIDHFIGDFTTGGWKLFAEGNEATRARVLQAPWTAATIGGHDLAATEALQRFEGANPGRGNDTILGHLASATHGAYVGSINNAKDFVSYNLNVHEFLAWAIDQGCIEQANVEKQDGKKVITGWTQVGQDLHTNPDKKFKVTKEGSVANLRFNITGLDEAGLADFKQKFKDATGKDFDTDPFVINTVAGDWEKLVAIDAGGTWNDKRGEFLFGLQAANVSAILLVLEDKTVLDTLAEGTVADRLQGLMTFLRFVNVGWRVKNPWNGTKDPLISEPFALKEDGGIGLDMIYLDAVTLRSTLDSLYDALEGRNGLTVNLPDAIAEGIRQAYANGLSDVLDLMLDKSALELAVRLNTAEYRSGGSV